MSEAAQTAQATPEADAGSSPAVAAAATTATTETSDKTLITSAEADTSTTGDEGSKAPGEGDKPKAEGEAASDDAPKVPETYELKLPEGVTIDDAALEAVSPVFKDIGLSNEQAQKVADVYMQIQNDQAAKAETAFAEQSKQWLSDAQADQEIGGGKLQEATQLTHKTLAAFGTPELSQTLENTGFGNHPEFIRFFARVGKAISEDGMVRAADAGGGPKSIEERLYGKTQKAA